MRWTVLAAMLVLLPREAPAQKAPSGKDGLTRLLDAELSRFPAKAGVYVKHLGTGEQAIVRGDDHFNSASVIKIPVMVLAFRMAEQNKLNLNDRVEIKRVRSARRVWDLPL